MFCNDIRKFYIVLIHLILLICILLIIQSITELHTMEYLFQNNHDMSNWKWNHTGNSFDQMNALKLDEWTRITSCTHWLAFSDFWVSLLQHKGIPTKSECKPWQSVWALLNAEEWSALPKAWTSIAGGVWCLLHSVDMAVWSLKCN